MDFEHVATLYSKLESTNGRVEKIALIYTFLQKHTPKNTFVISPQQIQDYINSQFTSNVETLTQKELTQIKQFIIVIKFLQGSVFEQRDNANLGISSQLIQKAIMSASAASKSEITTLLAQMGDLGLVAQDIFKRKKQQSLFAQKLNITQTYDTLLYLSKIDGNQSTDQKIKYITQLLIDASPVEACYLIRFILQTMRGGVGEGTLRDALIFTYLPKLKYMTTYNNESHTFTPQTLAQKDESEFDLKETDLKILTPTTQNSDELFTSEFENYDYIHTISSEQTRKLYIQMQQRTQYALDITADMLFISTLLFTSQFYQLHTLTPIPLKPVKLMLAQRGGKIKDAIKDLEMPLYAEYKYDGFRIQIHKSGDDIKLFTRRLENVSTQFPDVISYIKNHSPAENCILDAECVGYNAQTQRPVPFQEISQRIKRKYDIEQIIQTLPVCIRIFDILYVDGESIIEQPLHKRKIALSQIITNENHDCKRAEETLCQTESDIELFYQDALNQGHEGVMLKVKEAIYKPGSRVGTMIKIKPIMETIDAVITKANWGEGKRSAWLTSFTLSAQDDQGKLYEIGKVSSGLKETTQETEGIHTFSQITEELKKNQINTIDTQITVNPTIILEVAYEELQKSTTYASGFALRFPRIIRVRDDKPLSEITTVSQLNRYYDGQ